jgi:hypothetical protein
VSTSRSGFVAVSTVGFTAPVRITSILTSEPSRFTCSCSISAAPLLVCAGPQGTMSRSTRSSRVRCMTPRH